MTFLFTDVEGSTQLWESRAAEMEKALAAHDEVVRRAVEERGGYVFSTQGDSFAVAFARPADAVAAACTIQQDLEQVGPVAGVELRVRIGLHAGTADERDGDYFGRAPTRAARIMSAAHGGQVLVSAEVAGLVDDLGVRDLGEHRLKDLREPVRLLELDCSLDRSFPALRTADTVTGNLPRRLTSFIGRTDELRDLTALLRDARLVTLVGAGGTGKTRLALELADRLQDGFEHGAWLVELGQIRTGLGIDEAALAALGAPSGSGSALRDRLVDHLAARQLMLLVDNCEHVVDAAAPMIADVLERCPDVVVVATSREPLSIPGEQVVLLDPLPISRDDDGGASPAATLFIDRARSEGAVMDDAAIADVEELCSGLDGMPLAIELAAGRARSLPPSQMLALLDDRFRLLSRGQRVADDRHRTLRATVAWSYDLLTEIEQQVFDRLSVFVGPFDTRAAVAVAGDDDIDELDVIEALTSLHDRSMCASDAGPDGHRYRLLETLRAYGRENLEARGERDAARLRHAEHHIALVEQLRDEAFGSHEDAAARRVEEIAPELRAAVERCAELGRVEHVRRLVVPLRPFTWRAWYEPSYWIADVEPSLGRHDWMLDLLFLQAFVEVDADRGRALIDELTSRTPDGSSTLAVAHVFACFFCLTQLDEPELALHHAEEASRAARTEAADVVEHVMGEFASVIATAGSGPDALVHADLMVERSREAPWPTGECFGVMSRGYATEATDPEEAGTHYRAALELASAVGSTEIQGISRMRLLYVGVAIGHPASDLAALAGEAVGYWLERSNWVNLRVTIAPTIALLAETGRSRTAVMTLGALEHFEAQTQAAEHRIRAAGSAALETVGDDAEALLERGRRMSIVELAALVLKELDGIVPESDASSGPRE